MKSTTAPPDPSAHPRGRRGRRALPIWVWAAVLVLALAAGAGGALLAAPGTPGRLPDPSEAALVRAHDGAARLAAAARRLAAGQEGDGTPSPSASPSAAASGPVRQAAASAADVLELQARLLAASTPRSASTSEASRTASPASTATAQAAAAGSPVSLAAELSQSAAALRGDLARVDGPTASLLASTAAGQQLQSERLGLAAGVPSSGPGPSQAPSPSPSASAAASACPSPSGSSAAGAAGGAGTPSSAPSSSAGSAGTSKSSATSASSLAATAATPSGRGPAAEFAAVQSAEEAAVWTYTVLAARAGATERPALLAAAGVHRDQLDALEEAAAGTCATLPPAQAGFALPADAGSPAQVAALEASAVAGWSDLVAVVEAPTRAAAAGGLERAARRAAAVGALGSAAAAAFPGHRAAQSAAASLATPSPGAVSPTTASPATASPTTASSGTVPAPTTPPATATTPSAAAR